ncbi:MAG: biotin--[acetyl-CoA-carboxylase] ligase [Bacteroidales bacterium]
MIHIRETDSTNKELEKLLSETRLEEGSVVWCDIQTKGRGQKGNSWESEPYKNLTFSFVLYPEFLQLREHFLLSQLIAVSIVEELEQYSQGFSVKWPNDIYWKEKKIAGILIENDLIDSTIQSSIIGVGLNLNQKEFLSDAPNPISLTLITGNQYDRLEFLKSLMSRIYRHYLTLISEGGSDISAIYMSKLYRGKGFHRYRDMKGVEFNAEIIDVFPSGHISLRESDGRERSFLFKEVEFIISDMP